MTLCLSLPQMLLLVSLCSHFLDDNLNHPYWASPLGLCLWCLVVSPVFIGLVHEIMRSRGDSLEQVVILSILDIRVVMCPIKATFCVVLITAWTDMSFAAA